MVESNFVDLGQFGKTSDPRKPDDKDLEAKKQQRALRFNMSAEDVWAMQKSLDLGSSMRFESIE